MATIKDISRLTKLSPSTISKYMNGGNVLEENRVSIETAIKQLDYHVNEFARGLKTNRSNTIGIIIPDLRDSFATSIVYYTGKILREHGYGVMVCDNAHEPEQERQVISFLLNKRVDCIIALPSSNDGQVYEHVTEQGIPLIIIDQFIYGMKADTVLVNNRGAAYNAIMQLIHRGHKKIAFLAGPDHSYTGDERYKGYLDAMTRSHLEIDDSLIFRCDYTAEQAYHYSMQLFRKQPYPSAIVSANYDMTLGLISALNELNISIPENVSIMAFDDLILSKIIKPKLWVVAQPMQQIAALAAELTIKRVKKTDDSAPKTFILDTEIVEGESIKFI